MPPDTSTNVSPEDAMNALIAELQATAKQNLSLEQHLQHFANSIAKHLHTTGYAYHIRAGVQEFKCLLQDRAEAIFQGPHAQEFHNAIHQAAAIPAAFYFTPGQTIASPAGHTPAFSINNPTPNDHYIMPFGASVQVIGVAHLWFPNLSAEAVALRSDTLQTAFRCLENYLATLHVPELQGELARAHTMQHMLSELAGLDDIEVFGWNLANYGREITGCDRVCLYISKTYDLPMSESEKRTPNVHTYGVQAISGSKKVHPRSEHTTILRDVGIALAQRAVDERGQHAGHENVSPVEIIAWQVDRSGLGDMDTSPEVKRYFERMPMQWVCSLPLLDANEHVVGLMIFESRKTPLMPQMLLLRMQRMVQIGGKALSGLLHNNQRLALRLAKRWTRFASKLTPNKKRELSKLWAIGIAVVLGILLFPLPYNIEGEAVITPIKQTVLPIYRPARIETIHVKQGDQVQAGDLVAQLSTQQLELQQLALKQEYYRLVTESDRARNEGNESEMHRARIHADQVGTMIARFQQDIDRSALEAPFDGIIVGPARLDLIEGKMLMPGEPVVTLADLRDWQVRASVREQDLILLQEALSAGKELDGTLKLIAEPDDSIPLELSHPDQIIYGTTQFKDEYTYYVLFDLSLPLERGRELKDGYKGTATVRVGWRPIAYILFRDFKDYLAVRGLWPF